jgi:hypothetical protein
LRTLAMPTPLARAFAIAARIARTPATWPQPSFASKTALDVVSLTGVHSTFVDVTPALMRRTHCGSFPETPCIGRSRRSAQTIAFAAASASSPGIPTARRTLVAND